MGENLIQFPGRFQHELLTFARITGNLKLTEFSIYRKTGIMYNKHVTPHDTGFPGNPKKIFFFSL